MAAAAKNTTRRYGCCVRVRKLGPLEVSVVGLGCNNFGRRLDEAGTKAVVDAALDVGVTFFDTADRYGGQGGSESLLGKVLRGRRDRVVLATKFGMTMGDGVERRGRREYLRRSIEGSLRRLQTDYVDLYQHHEEDPDTPLEETFAALDELVAEGKILAYGTSNYNPETLERPPSIAGPAYVSEQSESLVARSPGQGGPAAGLRVARLVLHPALADGRDGLLTGKIHREPPEAEGTRLPST